MIFELFIAFIILSCILVFLGYYTTPSIKVLAVLGFATLFFLGLLLQFGSVTQKTGFVEDYSYNLTTNDTQSIMTSYSYEVINDSTSVWIGRWLSIVSVLSVALVFSSNRADDEDDDYDVKKTR